ncbi:RsmE family RNA methyltransferase [Kallotenue papyrolyticum]|uniref:RsmE family RNA methyltransferase n=1 Tax=Kallotenue papyrolyticum TaxID=1325125 RepID=UPI00047855B4|nr:RsmE family RNA methyltransferase [Kallotenue papyrolyticum]
MAKRPKRQPELRRERAASNTYRFFIAPGSISGRTVTIADAALSHQLSHVLRLSAGDRVTLLDNSGWEYTVVLEQIERDRIDGVIEQRRLATSEPRLKLTLYVPLLRGERFEWVLQKGTELGVSAFVPMVCQRSVIDDLAEISPTKLERWERIIREAAEQARRAKLPKLLPAMLFDTACEHAARRATAFVLWEGQGAQSLRRLLHAATQTPHGTAPFSIALLSGPEGGLTESELATAVMYRLPLASLGPRTLRAETAPLAAAAAVLWEAGDLD